jgi:hypothetical protein
MSHSELCAELDQRLDALLRGAGFIDLGEDPSDDSPEALELQQLLTTARLTLRALDEPLSPATQLRHLRMLEAAAARWGPKPRRGP